MAIKTLTKLAIPKEPNTIYARPEISTWPFCVFRNRNILSEHIPSHLNGRNELLQLSGEYTKSLTGRAFYYDSNKPIIATGHQPGWHHCGIFIKNLMGYKLTKKIDGQFIHVVLDHDIVDTALQLPETDKFGSCNMLSVNLDNNSDIPTGRIKCTHDTMKHFITGCTTTSPFNTFFKGSWNSISIESFFLKKRSASDSLTYMLDMLYKDLGIKMSYLPVSVISESNVFQDFCTNLICNFGAFAKHYNHAVSTSKSFTGISNLNTKKIQGYNFTELPLWLLTPENKRKTLWISNDNNSSLIATETEILVKTQKTETKSLYKTLDQIEYCIRPKAILLTCFLRLYLCGWFIHGIGGARYEVISDYLLKHYWKIDNLAYGTTSLTSYLFGQYCITAKDKLKHLRQKLRQFKCKPETLLTSDHDLSDKTDFLIKEKKRLVSLSNNRTLSSNERERAWKKIYSINQEFQRLLPDSEGSLLINIKKLEEKLSVFQRRDFFFGLFSKEYLDSFLEIINAQF